MAGEFVYNNRDKVGATLKVELFSLDGSLRWDGTDMAAIGASPTTSPAWENGLIDLTEKAYQGGSGTGLFIGDLPAALVGTVGYLYKVLDTPTTFAAVPVEIGDGTITSSGGGGSGDASLANQIAMLKLLRADIVVDKTTNPAAWSMVWYEAGTANELLRKPIKDVDGAALSSTDTIVGRVQQ